MSYLQPDCTIPATPELPFQMTVADFFEKARHKYLITQIAMSKSNAQVVNTTLREWFCTYRVPEELATDGDPPFDSHEYTTLLANWRVNRRLSVAYFPQRNGRAEAAIKTAKRILANNTDSFGLLGTDSVARALLLHRNTPVLDASISPAVMLYGHPIRDHLLSILSKEKNTSEWTAIRDLREEAMTKRNHRNASTFNEHARPLKQLEIGDHVRIQN